MPVFLQTIFDIIHWSTDKFTVFVSFTKVYGQSYFGKFGTHAKECRNPHPEYSTRTSNGNGACDSGNISGSDCGCKCSTDSLKRCHSSVRCLTFSEHAANGCFHSVREFPDLKKSCTDAEIKADSDNTDHSRNTPDKIVYCSVDCFNNR